MILFIRLLNISITEPLWEHYGISTQDSKELLRNIAWNPFGADLVFSFVEAEGASILKL